MTFKIVPPANSTNKDSNRLTNVLFVGVHDNVTLVKNINTQTRKSQ